MKLRHYETLYLLHPDLDDKEREALAEKFQNIITEDGGKIVKVDPWPLKKLAYRVQKQTQGYYVVLEYAAPGATIQELTRNMRLNEDLLKFVTIKKADTFDPAILERAQAEAAARAEAEAAAKAEAEAAAEAETKAGEPAEEEQSETGSEKPAADTEAVKE